MASGNIVGGMMDMSMGAMDMSIGNM